MCTGCTSLADYIHNGLKVGPNYAPAPASLAPAWIESKAFLDAADKRPRKDSDDLITWWKQFNDPALDELIETAAKQNLTLRQAGYRILQARALRGIAVGELFPQTQFADGSYVRTGTNREIAGAALSGKERFFDQWNVGFGLAWELDFWGRFRRAIEAADANLDASICDYNDVFVTLLSDVAVNYVQMRTLQKRIDYAHQNVKIQRETKETAQERSPIDKNGKLAARQAESLLNQTEALIPELEISLRLTTNRLCVLLGIPPEDLVKKLNPADSVIRIPEPPDNVTVGIPADLLRRRPDIRRAERQAAAQSAVIGVAEAEFYPHISLVGTLGWSAESFKNVFRSSAFNGTFGPSVQWNILHYGRIVNNVRFQDARFQELMAAYQNKVLVAQQEVEDGLVVFTNAKKRVELQRKSVNAAREAEGIATPLWRKVGGPPNGVDFTTVTLVQQNLVQQQDTLAQAQGEIALGLIQIYKALGGGWDPQSARCAPSAVHVQHGITIRPDDSEPAVRPVAEFGRPF